MSLNADDAKIIDRLRNAAREHGEVYDLLYILNQIDITSADKNIDHYFKVAKSAFAFCELDADREEENNG